MSSIKLLTDAHLPLLELLIDVLINLLPEHIVKSHHPNQKDKQGDCQQIKGYFVKKSQLISNL